MDPSKAAAEDLSALPATELSDERVARLDAMKLPELDALRAALVRDRRWPD